jgi:rubredoxin
MFGESFRCDECGFTFLSGWSHHTGGQHLVCSSCGGDFIAKDGSSVWGSEPGEKLSIYQNVYKKKVKNFTLVKTNLTIIATDEHPADAPMGCFYRLTTPLRSLACPACKESGVLVERLKDGCSCPLCKKGRIADGGKIIY